MRRLCLIALLLLSISGPAWSGETFAPGHRDLVYHDAARDRELTTALWYPSSGTAESIVYAQVHNGHAAADAEFAPGQHPLIVLSHGTGGNRFNQYYLGEALAAEGYIVAAIEHPGDRTFDNGDFGTAKNLYNRPRDVSAVLDALLADASLAPHIAPARIGVMGHSAGGFTAIVAAGGRPDLGLLLSYCAAQTTRSLTCPKTDESNANELPLHLDYIHGKLSLRDDRVKVLVVFAPAIGPMFDEAGLRDVDAPVQVFWAEQDEILNEPANSAHYGDGLRNVEIRAMPGIGHFTFLAPCSDLLRQYAPQICTDPAGIDRAGVTATIAREVIAFLDRSLGRN